MIRFPLRRREEPAVVAPVLQPNEPQPGPTPGQLAWMRQKWPAFAEAEAVARRIKTERDLSEQIAKGPSNQNVPPALQSPLESSQRERVTPARVRAATPGQPIQGEA